MFVTSFDTRCSYIKVGSLWDYRNGIVKSLAVNALRGYHVIFEQLYSYWISLITYSFSAMTTLLPSLLPIKLLGLVVT